MSDGLRDALKELIEELQEDPWVQVAYRLDDMLAAHPAAPAGPPAQALAEPACDCGRQVPPEKHSSTCAWGRWHLLNEAGLLPPVPAGDGGLREALEALIRDNVVVDRRPRDKHGPIGRLPEARVPTSVLQDLLAAHPAAPAVPQPVDREALAQAAHRYYCHQREAETHPLDVHDYDKADEILEILAVVS